MAAMPLVMTKEEHLLEMFELIDMNNNGTITAVELFTAMRHALAQCIIHVPSDRKTRYDVLSDMRSPASPTLTQADCDRLVLQVDTDQSGAVDFKEVNRPASSQGIVAHCRVKNGG